MKPEDKQIVFQDLCARLPYHVRCKIWLNKYGTTEEGPLDLEHNYGDVLQDAFFYHDRIKDIKPYLRPLSTMTEEEIIEFNNIPSTKNYTIIANDLPWDVAHYKQIDWLNKKMFDFRGLIPKGLAIKVTDENNPYKD